MVHEIIFRQATEHEDTVNEIFDIVSQQIEDLLIFYRYSNPEYINLLNLNTRQGRIRDIYQEKLITFFGQNVDREEILDNFATILIYLREQPININIAFNPQAFIRTNTLQGQTPEAIYAYYNSSTDDIVLTDNFFQQNSEDQAKIILHELTHLVLDTNDPDIENSDEETEYITGEALAQRVAERNPAEAAESALNYEEFFNVATEEPPMTPEQQARGEHYRVIPRRGQGEPGECKYFKSPRG